MDEELTTLFATYQALILQDHLPIGAPYEFYTILGFLRDKYYSDTNTFKNMKYRLVANTNPEHHLNTVVYG